MTSEKLQDKDSKGKERPWRSKKKRNLEVADSYRRINGERDKSSYEVKFCACSLTFEITPEGNKKLKGAIFCQKRLCPMCAWRKSLKIFTQVSRTIDALQEEQKDLVPLFLTLTVKNCNGVELPKVIGEMQEAWYQLTKQRHFSENIIGWFRALEINFNKEQKEFHPHYHVIIMVKKEYFKGKKYLTTEGWVKKWRTATKSDYDPICDIRAVKPKGKQKHKAIAEVAKYATKDTDYIHDKNELTDQVIYVLSSALRYRKLYCFGGELKKMAKRLKLGEIGEGDLINIDESAIRTDIATAIETYDWSFGTSNYILRD